MNYHLVYLHVLVCSGAYSNCKYMQIINSGIFLATYFWIKISGKRHLFLRNAKVLLRDPFTTRLLLKDTKLLLKTSPQEGCQNPTERFHLRVSKQTTPSILPSEELQIRNSGYVFASLWSDLISKDSTFSRNSRI